jgi:hypothetical protein
VQEDGRPAWNWEVGGQTDGITWFHPPNQPFISRLLPPAAFVSKKTWVPWGVRGPSHPPPPPPLHPKIPPVNPRKRFGGLSERLVYFRVVTLTGALLHHLKIIIFIFCQNVASLLCEVAEQPRRR